MMRAWLLILALALLAGQNGADPPASPAPDDILIEKAASGPSILRKLPLDPEVAARRQRARERRAGRAGEALGLPLEPLTLVPFDPDDPEATAPITDAIEKQFGLARALAYTSLPKPTAVETVFDATGALAGQVEHFDQFGAVRAYATGFGSFQPEDPYGYGDPEGARTYHAGACGDQPPVPPPGDLDPVEAAWLAQSWVLYARIDVPLPPDWALLTHEEQDAWMDREQKQEIAVRRLHPIPGPPAMLTLRPLSFWRYWRDHPEHEVDGQGVQPRRAVFRHLPCAVLCERDGETRVEPIVWEIDTAIGEFPSWERGEIQARFDAVDTVYGLPIVQPGGLHLHVTKRFPPKLEIGLDLPFEEDGDDPFAAP